MSHVPPLLAPAVWVSLLAAGFGYAWRYESTAGRGAAAADWPSVSALRPDRALPTLVMFAHPQCPCTKTGLEQLGELIARKPRRACLIVVIVGAPGLTKGLANSGTANLARRIPGASVLTDPAGREAKLFGATTSGQVFAFSPDGRQLFRGGVTVARGHYGPNAGIDALEAILASKAPRFPSTPVFGCSLRGDFEGGGWVR